MWTDQAGPQNDLPVVAEESSDDEARGASARDAEQYDKYKQREERLAGQGYSCDHCHCSVCKRSLEQHECQRGSVSSSSEPEVMSDDAGGIACHSLSCFHRSLRCLHFSVFVLFVIKFLLS